MAEETQRINNNVYLALREPWHRIPYLKQESIDEYLRLNVIPYKGTSYGDVEKRHWQELKASHKAGCDLVKVPAIEEIEVYE